MVELPSGTVAFLFTDVQNSTLLLERDRVAMDRALQRHHAIVRHAIEAHAGYIFETVGDAVYAVFARPSHAVAAALDAQLALQSENWGEPGPIRVRMGVHTGEVELREGGHYFGPALFRAARLMAIGYGGQVLLSRVTADHALSALPARTSVKDLGRYRLKDLAEDEQVFQLVHPELRTDFPPLKSIEAHPNNLPLQVTSFVGREKELARVKELLAMSRLLTLTGAGGSGKTRLSIQAAADLFERYPDGVWFIELASLAQPDLVAQTVASAMGIREDPGQPILATLLNTVGSKQCLVVLDNCEHLIVACARLADALIRTCSEVSVLATSREPLSIAGETTWQVPPLAAADPQRLPPIEQLTQYEAVRLFIDRACSARPDFVVNMHNAPAVAQICHRLGGIPLAIELAAARVKVLSPEQIAERLDDRFRLLTGGSRTALPRQQTLLALVNWSYDLLSEPERVLLRRLSVFAGGWTLQAAEKVCGGAIIESWEVLDLLTALVDKSLVLAEEERQGIVRYGMLETLRQYGRERLMESGESAEITAAHRGYYLRLAETMDPVLISRKQLDALERIEQEHDNFRAVLSGGHLESSDEGAVRLMAPLSMFWFYANFWSEAKTWLDQVLPRHHGPPTLESIRCLGVQGYLTAHLGDARTGDAILDQARGQAIELGSPLALSWVLVWRMILTFVRGEIADMERTSAELIEASTKAGFEWALALGEMGHGVTAALLGETRRARPLLEPVLERSRAIGDRMWIGICLTFLGQTAATLGDFELAINYLTEAVAEHRELGNRGPLSVSFRVWGHVALLKGDLLMAAARFSEGLAIAVALGKGTDIAGHMSGLGVVAAGLGRSEDAVRLFASAEAVRESCHAMPTPPEKALSDAAIANCQRALDEDDFRRAWSVGQHMPLEEATRMAQTVAGSTAPERYSTIG